MAQTFTVARSAKETTIIVSDIGVTRAFNEIAKLGADLTPALKAIGALLTASSKLRFVDGRGPDGATWAPLTSRQGQPLRNTGVHLMNPLHWRLEGKAVRVGVPYAWGAVHQFGATIVPKNKPRLVFKVGNRLVFAKKVVIPARPFLGVSEEDRAGIKDVLTTQFVKAKSGASS